MESNTDEALNAPVSGYVMAILAYLVWGIFPLFWIQFAHVPVIDLISWRVLWSCLFFYLSLFVISPRPKFQNVFKAVRFPTKLEFFKVVGATLMISSNWLLYVYAVTHGHIIESSLGYFINPLLNMALGLIFFGEALRTRQWLALLICATGVFILALQTGKFPWIAIVLALTFSLYGVFRKISLLKPMVASALETLLLAPVAVILIIYSASHNPLFYETFYGSRLFWILSFGGVLTAIPLLLFAIATKKIPLSALGFIQFLSPTIQFLVGWLVLKEPLNRDRIWAFVVVWIGIALFVADKIYSWKKPKKMLV